MTGALDGPAARLRHWLAVAADAVALPGSVPVPAVAQRPGLAVAPPVLGVRIAVDVAPPA
jgi:hypothetical protein